jgi:hypothetical protein
MVLVLETTETATATGLQTLRREVGGPLDGDDGGVRYFFDLSLPYSNPTLAAPANGQAIRDLAEVGDGTAVVLGTGVAYAGGGWDLTGLTGGDAYVQAPSGCLSSIWAGSQHFLVTTWARMPLEVGWPTTTPIRTIFQSALTDYQSGPDLVTINLAAGLRVEARRQTDGASTVVNTFISATAPIFGQVCQIGFWRNADGVGLRVRSAGGQRQATGPVGADNSGNFGLTRPQWGAVPGFAGFTLGSLYRGLVANLEDPLLDPTALLNADFDLVIGQNAFS